MGASIRMTTIKPRAPLMKSPRGPLQTQMRRWTAATIRSVRKYPPAQTDYVRTGRLGQGWEAEFRLAGDDLEAVVYNRVADIAGHDYSTFVQGPEGVQRDIFAGYGWKRIDEAGGEAWDLVLPDIRALFGDLQ